MCSSLCDVKDSHDDLFLQIVYFLYCLSCLDYSMTFLPLVLFIWDGVSCLPGWHQRLYVAESGLELPILLPLPSECWDLPPYLVYVVEKILHARPSIWCHKAQVSIHCGRVPWNDLNAALNHTGYQDLDRHLLFSKHYAAMCLWDWSPALTYFTGTL